MQQGVLKLIVVGDANVGKTCLINRYVDQTFNDTNPTLGVDFFTCKMDLYGQTHSIQVWDTAGQEKFKSVVKNYFRSASGVMVVFDLSNRSSFDHVLNWLEDMNDTVSENAVKALVGSKADLVESRAVSNEEARDLAERKGMLYFETSAKNALGVNVLFESVVRTILDGSMIKKNVPGQDQKPEGIKITPPANPNNNTNQKSGGCC